MQTIQTDRNASQPRREWETPTITVLQFRDARAGGGTGADGAGRAGDRS